MARREDVPVARIQFGPGPGMGLSIYGWTASEMGIPTVEVRGAYEGMELMKPETAEKIIAGLQLACRVARGEAMPTALDQFLERGK